MSRNPRTTSWGKPLGARIARLAVMMLCLGPAAVLACDTPVYRYAMYRWSPAPYEVYLLSKGALPAPLAELQKEMEAASRAQPVTLNLVPIAVDLDAENALANLPPDIRQAIEKQPDLKLPACLVSTPHGIPIFQGSLEPGDMQPMAISPKRTDLARQLEAGKAGVLVLLEGRDDDANKQAAEMLKQVIKDAAAGKIETLGPAPDPNEPASSTSSALEVGLLQVSRDDPKEQWLIRSLMAVEDDLHEFDTPMVFAVYGRARALPPYIGKGITRENMVDCLNFVTGACSCTVKEQNPGVDLLVQYDWEAASATVAEKFGTEEGNETQLGDAFFPELIIPTADPQAAADAGNPEPTDTEPGGTAVTTPNTDVEAEARPDQDPSPTTEDSGDSSHEPEEPADKTHVASADPLPEATAPEGAIYSSWFGMAIVGGGLLAGLVVLFVATLVVLHPR